MKIAVIGIGHTGLISGACFAEWGHDVVCMDKNAQKIDGLLRGVVPIYEPGLDQLVEYHSAVGRLGFTCDLREAMKGAAIAFIAVGTPPRADRDDTDLSDVYAAAREMAPLLEDGAVVAIKSTVPVGTGDSVQKIIGTLRAGKPFSVASNPVFPRDGTAIRNFLEPDRIVIGVEDDQARKILMELYCDLPNLRTTPVIVTGRRTAELTRYAVSAFLATKIAFINELASLCEHVGSNIKELSLGIGLDQRIGTSFLDAGPEYGESCFPKETMALLRTSQDHGIPLRIVGAAASCNEAHKRRMAAKVVDTLEGSVDGLTISILGLTFKLETGDMPDAPSVLLIETLQRLGAHIRVYDPVGMNNASHFLSNVEFCEDAYQCARDADAAVVIAGRDCIRDLDLCQLKRTMRQAILIDLRNALARDEAERLGFRVAAIGSPTTPSNMVNIANLLHLASHPAR